MPGFYSANERAHRPGAPVSIPDDAPARRKHSNKWMRSRAAKLAISKKLETETVHGVRGGKHGAHSEMSQENTFGPQNQRPS